LSSSPCLYRRLTARASVATGVPLGVNRTSGSLVRLPIRMTLLKLTMTYPPAIDSVAAAAPTAA